MHREDDSRTRFLKTHPGQTNTPHSPQRGQRAWTPLLPALRSSTSWQQTPRGHSGPAVLRKGSSRGRAYVLQVSRHAARRRQGETALGAASCPQCIILPAGYSEFPNS